MCKIEKMEAVTLKLTESEQRYFGELFSYCDTENQGRISGTKASELFLASQLPTETLHQITEVCGAKRLGHFGRSQFYIALKLIAAAQSGLPVKLEMLNSGMEIPLPKFGRGTDSGNRHSMHQPGQLPPPPTKSYRATSVNVHRQGSLKTDVETSPSHQPQSTFQHPTQTQTAGDSHRSSPSEMPSSPKGADHMHGDKSWASFQPDGHLNWAQFEEHHHLLGNEEDSSERHSSDEEYDFWTLTEEQREYYTNQFRQMQSDLKGRISGAAAKEFFEKSKLPVHELSKIWQLSDVDKDGALTIEEFCTAMHLVVLRRNSIELPDTLPPSLVPRIPQKAPEENRTYPPAQHQPQYQVVGSPKQSTPTDVVSPQNKEDPRILHPVAVRLSPDGQPVNYSNNEAEKQIEPSSESKRMSSSQAIQRPIPRKPSAPAPGAIPPPQNSIQASEAAVIDSTNAHVSASSFSGTSNTAASQSLLNTNQGPKKEPPPPPPPRPKHNHARSSSLDLNRLGKTVPHFLAIPPAVPPRMSPSTATPKRSLAALGVEDSQLGQEDNIDFADFTQFDESGAEIGQNSQPQLKAGAFEVYKKPFVPTNGTTVSSSAALTNLPDEISDLPMNDDNTALLGDLEQSEDRKRHVSAPPLALAATTIVSIPRDKREIQSAIRAHRERNMMLSLLNNELNQELSEVMEERIALEIQLEHMKPFS